MDIIFYLIVFIIVPFFYYSIDCKEELIETNIGNEEDEDEEDYEIV